MSADLLRFAAADNGELDIVALAHAAEHIDLFMIARDQRAEFAASHLQVVLGAVEIVLHNGHRAIDGIQIVAASLGGQLGFDVSYIGVEFGQLLIAVRADLGRFVPGLFQLRRR